MLSHVSSGNRLEGICGTLNITQQQRILARADRQREGQSFITCRAEARARICPEAQFAPLPAARAGIQEMPALRAAVRHSQNEVPSALYAKFSSIPQRF